jgi:hypothetical protein
LTRLAGIETDTMSRYHMGVTHHDSDCIVNDRTLPPQDKIDVNVKNGCLVILNHPNWTLNEHYTFEDLMSFENYYGIEIYNSVIERIKGIGFATYKWDRLLSAGRRVLGFATQDLHRQADFRDCSTVVRAADRRGPSLLEALKSGDCYGYYGVHIEDLGREKDTIFISTKNARLIRFVGFGGAIIKEVEDTEGEMNLADYKDTEYVRIECHGCGREMSWTQPFFKE